MPQFTACMIFEITNRNFPEASTSEELWVLVTSSNKNTALDLLMQNGASRNEIFLNSSNDEVKWLFKGIKNIQLLQIDASIAELVSLTNPVLSFVEFQHSNQLISVNSN